jgi:hypothetical protein
VATVAAAVVAAATAATAEIAKTPDPRLFKT